MHTEGKKNQTERCDIIFLNAYTVKTNPTTKETFQTCVESVLKLGMPQAFVKSDYSGLKPLFQNKEKAIFSFIVL